MLDRPIFIVGHARGGSTALAAIVNWHSHVGPRCGPLRQCESITVALERTRQSYAHLSYSERIEQKDIWFDYFPGEDVFTHMGNELIVEHCFHGARKRSELVERLTGDFREKRFLSKAPSNSFRVRPIRELFPDAKIVALYRRGEEVTASWGERTYGFGKKIAWGEMQTKSLSYRRGIDVFTRKWQETLDYLEGARWDQDMFAMTYDQLVSNTADTLKRLFDYLELPAESYLNDVRLADTRAKWKKTIPLWYRFYLRQRVRRGNAVLSSIERHADGKRRVA